MFNRKKISVQKEEPKKPTLLDKMQESKNQHGIAFIGIYNDGKIQVDKQYETVMMKYANDKDAFDNIGDAMYKVNESYSRDHDFDTLNLKLSVGLLFSGKDVDENQKVKESAEPVKDIVRYYVDKSACYLNDEEIKDIDWAHLKYTNGFINYNILVKSAEENGLVFNGPKTFEEFKEHILVGEPFDISLTARFNSKEKETQYTKTK